MFFQHCAELREELRGIMRARRCLGMILHTKDRLRLVMHAVDGLVVQIHAIDGNVAGKRLRVDGESVVLRCDFNLARVEVLHRLIAAAMAELQLESFSAERLSENLVSQTDAEDRDPGLDEFADGADGVSERSGIAGAV